MKIVLAGGTGQLGGVLARRFAAKGWDVVVIARSASPFARSVPWDGKTLGAWAREIEASDVVFNLAGKNVNCRYTRENLDEMMRSRVDSTRVVGEAIARAERPPRVWLQMSTATIYAHSFDAPNDEETGVLGGGEPGAPASWDNSIAIAKAWEKTLDEASTPKTRKVALRASVVLSPDRGGIFDVLYGLTKRRLGGAIAGGAQFVSWIHHEDFARAADLLIERDDLRGAVNVASPSPLPQREFMRVLREAADVSVGLPATRWMASFGALFLRTETELVLKSRRVVPKRLLDAGFTFRFPDWPSAAADLVAARAAE